jgi:hypothetical protein
VSDERTAPDEGGAGPEDDADEQPVGAAAGAPVTAEADDEELDADTADPVADAQAAIAEARRRLAEAPAESVVANHAMGLYELAAIHLSVDEPNLPAASLAIDAVACLVDGLGDRLGPDTPVLRDALANIRMAFVQVKNRGRTTEPSGPASPPVD